MRRWCTTFSSGFDRPWRSCWEGWTPRGGSKCVLVLWSCQDAEDTQICTQLSYMTACWLGAAVVWRSLGEFNRDETCVSSVSLNLSSWLSLLVGIFLMRDQNRIYFCCFPNPAWNAHCFPPICETVGDDDLLPWCWGETGIILWETHERQNHNTRDITRLLHVMIKQAAPRGWKWRLLSATLYIR